MTTFAVIAGGGTAGHVLPGLAVADALVARGHRPEEIVFLGAERGMEATLVPERGYRVEVLALQGMRRSFRPHAISHNLVAVWKLVAGTVAAVGRLGRWRPRVVVSVGGYASVPGVLAARLRRVPIVVISYDALPGRASRLEARLATACAVAFASSPLPHRVVTGAPVRPEIAALREGRDARSARAALGLPVDRFTVLVFGGSLGSGALNDAVRGLLERWAGRTDVTVRHVLGERNDDGTRVGRDGGDGIAYVPVRYERRMDLAYAAADVVVARAGATTVAELACAGVPAVLVPWPQAAEDHQTANARVLADVGGAVLLPELDLSADRLAAELDRLQADPAARSALGDAARAQGRPDAALAVAALVEESARP